MTRTCKFLVVSLSATLAGCTTSRPLATWQQGLTDYVTRQGGGDPNILRTMQAARSRDALRPNWITYGELDVPGTMLPPFADTYDVQGVMVGQQELGGKRWMVFLVATVRRDRTPSGTIEDLRLAAFSPGAKGELFWRVSPPGDPALRAYASVFAAKDGPMPGVFPSPVDRFQFHAEGADITVTEERSGATWRLSLFPGQRLAAGLARQ